MSNPKTGVRTGYDSSGALPGVDHRSEAVPPKPASASLSVHISGTSSARRQDDPQVIAALQEYLAALEAGTKPQRTEFLSRHPAIASVLADCLDAMDFVHTAGAELSGSRADNPLEPNLAGCLGDFRLIREIGRGGMGVVYEAEQISLGRRVALKIPPFAAVLDAKQLQRFKNEAMAAAGLDHPHIVHVYFVGSERSVHFYAMPFVDGHTLADVIQELRHCAGLERDAIGDQQSDAASLAETDRLANTAHQPLSSTTALDTLTTERLTKSADYFRNVAQLGIQAAEALDHAHQSGIVHRDIKPANLLLDSRGSIWVTDFGLAQFRKDHGLTITGDFVGTLRYMSPEQALGKRVAVDHRSDVYSLGATLYELLTLQPVLSGRDRQELLNQIANEEPRPPRTANPNIPADLETIVLKALAKEPGRRYANAQEFADDLARFCKDEAILAKRPTLAERLSRWSHRHRSIVRTAVLVAMFAMAVGSFLVWREKEQTKAEKEQTKAALSLAQARTRWARRAVDDMYTQVAEKWLADAPLMTETQRTFLARALEFYEELAKERSNDPNIRLETGRAYRRVGDIHNLMGNSGRAVDPLQKAVAIFENLLAEFAGDLAYQRELLLTYHGLARGLEECDRLMEAEDLQRDGLAIAVSLAAEFPESPEYQRNVAICCQVLGRILARTNRTAEAEDWFRRAVSIHKEILAKYPTYHDKAQGFPSALGDLSEFLGTLDRRDESMELARQVIDIIEEQSSESRLPLVSRNLAPCFYNLLAGELMDAHRYEEAEIAINRCKEIREMLHAEFPIPYMDAALARTYNNWARLLAHTGRAEESKAVFEKALSFQRKVVDEVPNQPSRLYDFAVMHSNLACLLATCTDPQIRDPSGALRLGKKAVELIPTAGDPWNTVSTGVMCLYYRVRDQRARVAAIWNTLGVAQYRTDDWRACVETLNRSMDLNHGGDSFDWFPLAMAHWQLHDTEEARQWYDRAVDWMDSNMPQDKELNRFRAEAQQLMELDL